MLSKSICRLSTAVKGLKLEKNLANLKLPEFLNFHGPTGEEYVKGLDLTGKTCLITGGNSGVGLEMTKCLLSRNCNVLMGVRNTYAASVAVKQFDFDRAHLQLYETNLASLESVKKCIDQLLKEKPVIDIVILNAAVFGIPWALTPDNLETTFQVNYLSQYYLLTAIEPLLAKNARVVIISSESHRNVKWTMQNILYPSEELLSLPKDKYTSIKAYNVSKFCGIHAMHYLSYRWSNSGKAILCAHPGSFVKTKLCTNWWPYEVLYTVMLPFSKSVAQAAATPLYCATAPELQSCSGFYFKDMKQADESELARDTHLSFKLMELTQSMLLSRVETGALIEKPTITKENLIDMTHKEPKASLEEPILSHV